MDPTSPSILLSVAMAVSHQVAIHVHGPRILLPCESGSAVAPGTSKAVPKIVRMCTIRPIRQLDVEYVRIGWNVTATGLGSRRTKSVYTN